MACLTKMPTRDTFARRVELVPGPTVGIVPSIGSLPPFKPYVVAGQFNQLAATHTLVLSIPEGNMGNVIVQSTSMAMNWIIADTMDRIESRQRIQTGPASWGQAWVPSGCNIWASMGGWGLIPAGAPPLAPVPPIDTVFSDGCFSANSNAGFAPTVPSGATGQRSVAEWYPTTQTFPIFNQYSLTTLESPPPTVVGGPAMRILPVGRAYYFCAPGLARGFHFKSTEVCDIRTFSMQPLPSASAQISIHAAVTELDMMVAATEIVSIENTGAAAAQMSICWNTTGGLK